jgi:endoglucanase
VGPGRARSGRDRNSAADGDILIAWALARAARLWGEPGHREAARAIANDVLARLVVRHGDLALLLPGPEGFVHGEVVTVNLSYWVFPAFAELDAVAPSPLWAALTASGLLLIERARFGAHGLPSYWLALGERLQPSPLFPPTFGYDAIRVPLHLVWAGLDDEDLLRPFALWGGTAGGRSPATVDLITGEHSPEAISEGARAVLALAGAAPGGDPPALPRLGDDADYFAASLLLLSKLAQAERSVP